MLIKQNQLVINGTTLEQSDLQAIANVASDVQAQIDTKAPINNAQFTGNVGIGTNSPASTLDTGYTRIYNSGAASTPSSGKGLEVHYVTSGRTQGEGAYLIPYDRDNSQYKPLTVDAQTIRLVGGNTLIADNGRTDTFVPSQRLHVYDPSTAYILAETGGTGTSAGHRSTAGSNDWVWFATEGQPNYRLYDYSSSAVRLTVKNDGNVGIGTTSPEVKLEVNGGADGSVVFGGRSDGGNGNNRRFNLIAYADGGGTNYGGGLKIQTRDSVNVFHDRITVQSNGNVGIGITNPSAKLHTKETTSDTISAATAGVKFDGSGNDGLAFGNMSSAPWTSWIQAGYLLDGYSPAFNNGYPLALNPVGGNVGIGITNPTAHLEISAGAPTLILNANSQPSGKKKVRLAASQVTAGDFHIQSMADNGTTVNSTPFLIDTNGITKPDKLQPSKYEPNIKWTQVTGGFNGSGGTQATSMTWYPITNQSMNNYNSDYSGGARGINFMIKWTSGNVNRGYHHTVTGHIPILSANAYIGYQNATYSTQASGTSMSEGLNLNISHHTGCVSGHNIQCRLYGDGSDYGAIYLQIRAEATPQNGDAYISFWKV